MAGFRSLSCSSVLLLFAPVLAKKVRFTSQDSEQVLLHLAAENGF